MKKILIASGGEIACRIIRTARRMGIATVAVHTKADAQALHVKMADEAVPVSLSAEACLPADAVLRVARDVGADAIHPGISRLAENADLAASMRADGLVFIGPSTEAIRALAQKDSAKARMRSTGIPVIPGYIGEDQSLARLERMGENIGYPLLIKAVAGRGSQSMRIVPTRADFTKAMVAAKKEASAAFGNDGIMLEKLIQRPRHVEVQIFGDSHGNIVHLFERDCSLRLAGQPLINEAPAPALSDHLRQILGLAAVTAGLSLEYENAGTVEFLLDLDDLDEAGDPAFYFVDMSPRLSAEYAVTEEITGIDLVEWQIEVARGGMLPLMQEAIEHRGHAIEAHLYAKLPEASSGSVNPRITRLEWPGANHVRVETGITEGDEIGDQALAAKIVTRAPTRKEALAALTSALDATILEGPDTNRAFLARLSNDPELLADQVDTGFIKRRMAELTPAPPDPPSAVFALLFAFEAGSRRAPVANGPFARPFRINLSARSPLVLWSPDGDEVTCWIETKGSTVIVHLGEAAFRVDGLSSTGTCVEGAVEGSALSFICITEGQQIEVRHGGCAWQFHRANPRWAEGSH